MVLKATEFKESDKIIWLFTEKLGKISVIAKGARKSKSKLLSLSLPFCFGDYTVFKGKSMYILNEGEIINSFQSLLNDLESLTYASYLCELIDIALVEEESNRTLFKDFMTVFYLMQKNAIDNDLLIRAFEVKIIAASGYFFNLDNCYACKKKINTSDFLNLESLSGACSDCEKTGGLKISFAAYNALKYLSKTPVENVHRLSLSKDTRDELYRVLSHIITNNFGRKPNSLETLNFLKGVE